MNYPNWLLEHLGGGTLIAIISIIHVYIAHIAVGGGIFIWLLDRKQMKTGDTALNDFLRRYNWAFLLLTMVAGGMTGVGIWFVIGLVSPEATSALIHNFVFGWAIEWVFFLGEVTALIIYHYFFDKLERKARQTIAFLYALFAWLSLFIINGILAFMLSPGKWLETHYFWDGFLNPTYFSSLFFRTFIAILAAGLLAFLIGSYQKEMELRRRVQKTGLLWLLVAFVGLIITGFWYLKSIPAAQFAVAFNLNPSMSTFSTLLAVASLLVVLFSITYLLKLPVGAQRFIGYLVVLLGLAWMGGFEYMREIARKPYVIGDYLYSNSIFVHDVDRLNQEGVLPNAIWSEVDEVTPENVLEAGREIYLLECAACHTMGGRNDILSRTKMFPYMGMMAMLAGQGKVQTYMPPFVGTDAEMDALARYIVQGLHGKVIEERPGEHLPHANTVARPDYDAKKGGYVLLAWNDLGMHCISDSDPWFVILPPANTLEAVLIQRGQTPVRIDDGVTLTYKADPEYMNPSDHVPFWDFAKVNYGADLEKNIGLAGNGLAGEFVFAASGDHYVAKMIPITPYRDDGIYDPYPALTVEAHDSETGELLASTRVVAPTSTEMGCRNCHGGNWRVDDYSGVADETAINILDAHDRLSGTNLLEQAINGNPMICQACHGDPAVGVEGKPEHLRLSSAIHGWHANTMQVQGEQACAMCHPAFPDGSTRCLRGIHNTLGLTCVDCHGTLDEHAMSLLKAEGDKKSVAGLMANLEVSHVGSKDEVKGRVPWLNEPDCLSCHENFEKPAENPSAYNKWVDGFGDLFRVRTDGADLKCEACHGATHALYPAVNPYDKDRDNMQPLQYQDSVYPVGSEMQCTVCHTEVFDFSIHHDNMLRPFRNKETVKPN